MRLNTVIISSSLLDHIQVHLGQNHRCLTYSSELDPEYYQEAIGVWLTSADLSSFRCSEDVLNQLFIVECRSSLTTLGREVSSDLTPDISLDYPTPFDTTDGSFLQTIRLQNRWTDKENALYEKQIEVNSAQSVLIDTLPPLRALNAHISQSSDRTQKLYNRLLSNFEDKRSSTFTLPIIKPFTRSGIPPCSLSALCTDVLDSLICPSSWFKPGPEDFTVQIDVKATKRALTLIFSQFSDLGGSPSVRVLPSGQGVSVHIEIEDSIKLDPRTHPRFEKDISYSRRIAELQSGEIQLNPTLGGGLRFTWFFPQVIERFPLDSVEESTMTQSLIWLIDDEPAVRLTVRRWLIQLGYSVETFAEGPVLLEQIKDTQHLPSLIICDADMPAMPGLEVLGHTSKSHPDIKRLLYTAREPNRWVIEAFNRGVIHRFIDKSEGPDALKICLQELLSSESQKNAHLKDLDELLSQELIELFIQPIFNSKTRKIEAGEALMRSKHPAFRGPLDILDATQLAQRELDLQRLLTKQSRVIREKIDPSIKLFMNIDPVVFSQPDALDDVFSEVYPYADQTVLELTERGQLCGDVWVESVKYLRKRGFEIALDDLGAGYNSLGAVAAVSPEIIKLDISLVSNLHLSAPKREMVRLLSEYATQHDIKTVAEGIELAEEAEICEGLDIRWLQGYHLERPMPFGAFYDKYVNGPKASDD